MPTVLRINSHSKGKRVQSALPITQGAIEDLDTRVALIQALLPWGLEAVQDVLQQPLPFRACALQMAPPEVKSER